MNKASLTNLTNAELSRLDPEQTPGVYQEVFTRFIDDDNQFDTGFDEGYLQGRAENTGAIRDLCAAQAGDKELWLSHHPILSKALRDLHNVITGD